MRAQRLLRPAIVLAGLMLGVATLAPGTPVAELAAVAPVALHASGADSAPLDAALLDAPRLEATMQSASTTAGAAACAPGAGAADEAYLSWDKDRLMAVGTALYEKGRVGRFLDTRMLKTERAANYKLAATWLTPDVIRASARLRQLTEGTAPDEARTMVCQADAIKDTVVLVEIDPREGSGVIPLDWTALLRPVHADGTEGQAVRGTSTPALREVPALAGVQRRNYDYDRFWVVFPLRHADGTPVLPRDAARAELVVRIHEREGRVSWPIPSSVRALTPAGPAVP